MATTMRWRGAYPVIVPDTLAWGNDEEKLLAFLKDAIHKQVDGIRFADEFWHEEEG